MPEQAEAVLSTEVSTDIFRLPSKGAKKIKNQLFEAFGNTICSDAISMKESGNRLGDDAASA